MPDDSLRQLCDGFCRIAGVAVPQLWEQDDGVVAFNIVWRQIAVDVIVKPAADPEHAFLLFDLGAPDPSRADPVRMWQALLHANFMALHANQPVFSCHPDTDRVVLQWSVALRDTTPEHLHQVVQEGVNLALLWQEDYFLPEPQTQHAAKVAPAAGEYA